MKQFAVVPAFPLVVSMLIHLAPGLPVVVGAATPLRVLLIGNSYAAGTAGHLPHFFNAQSGYALTLKSYTPGGHFLWQHLDNSGVRLDIATGSYDVVIMQEQSQTPSIAYRDYAIYSGSTNTFAVYAQQRLDANGIDPIPGGHYYSELVEYFWGGAFGLSELVNTSSVSRILYFNHWARHTNDTSFLPNFPGANGGEQAAWMLEANNQAFDAVQSVAGSRAQQARIGDAWSLSYRLRPNYMLHHADRSHGNASGYYLAAAVLFEMITGRSSIGNSYTAGLSVQDALYLQSVATRSTGMHRIRQVALADGSVSVELHGISPLRHQLQTAPSPTGSWAVASGIVTGSDAVISLITTGDLPKAAVYRVHIWPP